MKTPEHLHTRTGGFPGIAGEKRGPVIGGRRIKYAPLHIYDWPGLIGARAFSSGEGAGAERRVMAARELLSIILEGSRLCLTARARMGGYPSARFFLSGLRLRRR